MCHTWKPADWVLTAKTSHVKAEQVSLKLKAKCLCESIHAGGVLVQVMQNYKKSQAQISKYSHTEALKKYIPMQDSMQK